MRKRIRRRAEKMGLYPFWLVIRYFVFEYFYEKKRGRAIDSGKSGEYKWLEEYKDKYQGKRCFVICNGPSLTEEDYIKLKDEYTFGMNMIFNWFEKTDIETDFLVVQDYFSRAVEMQEGFKKVKKSKVILSDHIFKKYGYDTDVCHFRVPASMWNMHFPNRFQRFMVNDEKIGFAIGKSVAFLCVELACFMGFKEIYLIGSDCTFEGGIKNMHASGLNGSELNDDKIDRMEQYMLKNKRRIYQGIIADYMIAKRYSKKYGIDIFNATKGGALEVFPRVDLDDVGFKISNVK